MVRGHAEALIPLIARVMAQARHRFRRARPHRRHHRPRQLHRTARRHRRGARHRARRRQARDRPDDAGRLSPRPTSPMTTRPRSRSRSTRGTARLSADLRPGRAHAGRAAHRQRRRRGARGGHRHGRIVGTGANMLAAAWPDARTAAGAGRGPARARHRLGRRGSGSPPTKAQATPSRSICARPTRSRRTPRGCRADDRRWLARLFARGEPALSEARPRDAARHRGAARGFVPARLERRRIRTAAARTQRRRASRHDAGARCTASSCRGSPPTKPKSFRSRSRRRGAAAGLRARCSTCTCGGSRASARAPCSSKSTRTTRRRGGSTRARAFARSGGGRATTSTAADHAATALVLRRDLV